VGTEASTPGAERRGQWAVELHTKELSPGQYDGVEQMSTVTNAAHPLKS
jgi:hypothetical protein